MSLAYFMLSAQVHLKLRWTLVSFWDGLAQVLTSGMQNGLLSNGLNSDLV